MKRGRERLGQHSSPGFGGRVGFQQRSERNRQIDRFVSVHGHIVGDRLHEMIDAYLRGDVASALAIHRELLPVYTGMTRAQGVITTKAALGMLGLPGGPVRLPLVDATPAETEQLRADLVAGGVKLR